MSISDLELILQRWL